MTFDSTTVYAFAVPTRDDDAEIALFKATREAIEAEHHGIVLEGTAQVVSLDELDENGRYRRVPSGWMDL